MYIHYKNKFRGHGTYIIFLGKPKKPELIPAPYRRTSLMYEHETKDFDDVATVHDETRIEKVMSSVLNLLEDMSLHKRTLNVKRDTAENFGKLIRLMRELQTEQLFNLATLLPQSDVAR
jgi:hypothetical protein